MSTAWGERLQMLHASRSALDALPTDQLFELPGRPNVMYSIKDYRADKLAGAQECRSDMSFLFKAFETGQIGPRRLTRLVGENKPRNATIHEYLDWTVTGKEAATEGDYDFSGFRVLVLLPRERVMWPRPGQYDQPEPKKHPLLGAPLDPLPQLMVKIPQGQAKGRPLTAATIRTGPDYIEVPFVATHESKRGRGFGRCIIEAIEEVARALGIPRMLLCSTRETSVAATWRHLGFSETTEAQLASWGVEDSDLVHMQNTLQMHKDVPPPRVWRPLVIRHQAFVARVYMCADKQALSSKSCVQRPGMHDMGAVSGYGRSSRATTSGLTTASNASNGSYGTSEQQRQRQQARDGDDGGSSRQPPQKGNTDPVVAAGAAGDGTPQPSEQQQQQQQQPGPGSGAGGGQDDPPQQQQQDSDAMLVDEPPAMQQPQQQQEGLICGSSVGLDAAAAVPSDAAPSTAPQPPEPSAAAQPPPEPAAAAAPGMGS